MIHLTFVPFCSLPLFLLTAGKNHFSHGFDTLGQRSLCRADVTAASALTALHTIQGFKACHITTFSQRSQTCRKNMTWTATYAASAVDTRCLDLLCFSYCIIFQEKERRCCLCTCLLYTSGNIQTEQCMLCLHRLAGISRHFA